MNEMLLMFVCGKLKSYFPCSAWAPGIPQRTLISQSWQMNTQNNQANQLSVKAATVSALPWRLLTSLNCWSWERKGDTWTCRIALICSCFNQQRPHSHDLSWCFSAAFSAIYMRCGIWLVKKLTLWHEHILFDVFCCYRRCDCSNFHKSDILKSSSAFSNAKKKAEGNAEFTQEKEVLTVYAPKFRCLSLNPTKYNPNCSVSNRFTVLATKQAKLYKTAATVCKNSHTDCLFRKKRNAVSAFCSAYF